MEKQTTPPKIKEQLDGRVETVEYLDGKVEVAEYGKPNPEHHDVMIVPGYTEGLVALNNFAKELAEQGDRRVVFYEQPKSKPFNGRSSIDDQATALLAVIDELGSWGKPLDFVAHSMGAIVFARAMEIAKKRRQPLLELKGGNKVVFVAPAGFYERESYPKLAGRFASRAKNFTFGDEATLTKTTPNGKEVGAGGPKSVIRRPVASTKETYPLARERIVDTLGWLSIKPHIVLYPNDELYGWDVLKGDIGVPNLYDFNGIAMPIGSEHPGAISKKEFALATGLKGKELKEAWAKNHSNASHNDLLFIPGRTVGAVLQILDGKVDDVSANK